MASLRTQSAAKLLRTATSRPAFSVTQRRFKTDDSKALTESVPSAAATPAHALVAVLVTDWRSRHDQRTQRISMAVEPLRR